MNGPREGLEIAHNGVRGDNDVAVREARRGSNRITKSDEEGDKMKSGRKRIGIGIGICAIASLLGSTGATRIAASGGGADIGPSIVAGRVPAMSLEVEGSKYFLIHHTAADTVDKIDPAEFARCVAAMTGMAYVVADMPQRLGEAAGTQ